MTTSVIEFLIAAKTIRRISPVLSEPAYSVLVDNRRRTEPIYFEINHKYNPTQYQSLWKHTLPMLTHTLCKVHFIANSHLRFLSISYASVSKIVNMLELNNQRDSKVETNF